ncbi:MAG TPA: CehA/McbA family metallohydrolase, partial [Myxococcota bacterium]|nr:CehA/McbA family metallohydrolase [Myxococcota bacterium]
DGEPFTVWLDALDAPPARDPRVDDDGPSGHAAAGFARDGEVELRVPAGRYRLVMHRGIRYELHTEDVTVAAGQTLEVTAALPAAYPHPGWLWGDPHSHGAPSGDASIPMEDRLIVHAAAGYQVHFGTDHDHVADYRPLIAPLGLEGRLVTVVADEVSPPLRGHFNIYPVQPKPEANGGAFAWWTEFPATTDAMFASLRARHGDRFILQSNHPTDSGMGSSAGWSPGHVDDPTRWGAGIQAVEVLNSSDWESFLPFFLDITAHGQLVAPVGVTDSHHHFGGGPGYNGTFLGVGVDEPAELTDDLLVDTMRARRTIVSRGPFLELSVDPGSTVTGALDVHVVARSPSWIRIDHLRLLEDGVEVEVVDGAEATFQRTPDADAWYVIIADGGSPMTPVTGNTPWAMAAPILVDADGGGWTAPLGPLVP